MFIDYFEYISLKTYGILANQFHLGYRHFTLTFIKIYANFQTKLQLLIKYFAKLKVVF